MTNLDQLAALTAYPVPRSALESILSAQAIDPAATPAPKAMRDAPFLRSKAALYDWLALAPNVQQGGQSYTLSDAQREEFAREAQRLRAEASGASSQPVRYGYKGSRL